MTSKAAHKNTYDINVLSYAIGKHFNPYAAGG